MGENTISVSKEFRQFERVSVSTWLRTIYKLWLPINILPSMKAGAFTICFEGCFFHSESVFNILYKEFLQEKTAILSNNNNKLFQSIIIPIFQSYAWLHRICYTISSSRTNIAIFPLEILDFKLERILICWYL